MKTDLATSVVIAIVGVLIAYFACDFIVQPIQSAQIKSVDTSVSSSVDEPSVEVFNDETLNPTVEVYVGNCTEYNESGECIEGSIIENYDIENTIENEEPIEESIEEQEDVTVEEQETP